MKSTVILCEKFTLNVVKLCTQFCSAAARRQKWAANRRRDIRYLLRSEKTARSNDSIKPLILVFVLPSTQTLTEPGQYLTNNTQLCVVVSATGCRQDIIIFAFGFKCIVEAGSWHDKKGIAKRRQWGAQHKPSTVLPHQNQPEGTLCGRAAAAVCIGEANSRLFKQHHLYFVCAWNPHYYIKQRLFENLFLFLFRCKLNVWFQM